jgi:hypothetical protein
LSFLKNSFVPLDQKNVPGFIFAYQQTKQKAEIEGKNQN